MRDSSLRFLSISVCGIFASTLFAETPNTLRFIGANTLETQQAFCGTVELSFGSFDTEANDESVAMRLARIELPRANEVFQDQKSPQHPPIFRYDFNEPVAESELSDDLIVVNGLCTESGHTLRYSQSYTRSLHQSGIYIATGNLVKTIIDKEAKMLDEIKRIRRARGNTELKLSTVSVSGFTIRGLAPREAHALMSKHKIAVLRHMVIRYPDEHRKLSEFSKYQPTIRENPDHDIYQISELTHLDLHIAEDDIHFLVYRKNK